MSYENDDNIKIFDPSSFILTFAITLSVFPLAVGVIVDPILNQRTTLRDILSVYIGKCMMFCLFAKTHYL